MFNVPIRILHLLGWGAVPAPGSLRPSPGPAPRASQAPFPQTLATETASMSEQYQLELIRSYASSGFAAVITINSGALIGGLSQAGNLEAFSPVVIASAVEVVEGEGPAEAFRLPEVGGVAVVPGVADGEKCQRCWKVLPEVGTQAGHPDLCARCADVVEGMA